MKAAYLLAGFVLLYFHLVFAAPLKTFHSRAKTETIGDPEKQSITHTYHDPVRGPTKIEVTNAGKNRVHKQVFTKPHAGAEWVDHPEEDVKDEEVEYNFEDADGRKHEVSHGFGMNEREMRTRHRQSGGSALKYGLGNTRLTTYINGETNQDVQDRHVAGAGLAYSSRKIENTGADGSRPGGGGTRRFGLNRDN